MTVRRISNGNASVAKARKKRVFNRISVSGESKEYISGMLQRANSCFQLRIGKLRQQKKKNKSNLKPTSGSSAAAAIRKVSDKCFSTFVISQ